MFWAPPGQRPHRHSKELVIRRPTRAKRSGRDGGCVDTDRESTARFNVAMAGDTDRTRDVVRGREKAPVNRDCGESRFRYLKEEM